MYLSSVWDSSLKLSDFPVPTPIPPSYFSPTCSRWQPSYLKSASKALPLLTLLFSANRPTEKNREILIHFLFPDMGRLMLDVVRIFFFFIYIYFFKYTPPFFRTLEYEFVAAILFFRVFFCTTTPSIHTIPYRHVPPSAFLIPHTDEELHSTYPFCRKKCSTEKIHYFFGISLHF